MVPSKMSPDMPAFSNKGLNLTSINNWRGRVNTTDVELAIVKRLRDCHDVHFMFKGATSIGPFPWEMISGYTILSSCPCTAAFDPIGYGIEFDGIKLEDLIKMPFEKIDWTNHPILCFGLIAMHRALILRKTGWFPGADINISLVGIAGLIVGPLGLEVTL